MTDLMRFGWGGALFQGRNLKREVVGNNRWYSVESDEFEKRFMECVLEEIEERQEYYVQHLPKPQSATIKGLVNLVIQGKYKVHPVKIVEIDANKAKYEDLVFYFPETNQQIISKCCLAIQDELILNAITLYLSLEFQERENLPFYKGSFHAKGEYHKEMQFPEFECFKDVYDTWFKLKADRVYHIDFYEKVPVYINRDILFSGFSNRVNNSILLDIIYDFLNNKYLAEDDKDITSYLKGYFPVLPNELYDLMTHLYMNDRFDVLFRELNPNYTIMRASHEVFVFLSKNEIDSFEEDINRYRFLYNMDFDISFTEFGSPPIKVRRFYCLYTLNEKGFLERRRMDD